MPRSILVTACAALLLLPLAAPALPAQRPVSIGVGGGASLPQGTLGDATNTGWHALAVIALGATMQPLGLRLDLAHNQFALSDRARVALGGSGHESVTSATLNATYRLPMTDSPMSPYLVSGLGAYRSDCSLDVGCDATTRYGWNVGLGAKLVGFGLRSFVEARYHRTSRGGSAVHYVPLTVGLTF